MFEVLYKGEALCTCNKGCCRSTASYSNAVVTRNNHQFLNGNSILDYRIFKI